jgi:cyclophilin family peptidyl-prolyl cis-trans isomerase
MMSPRNHYKSAKQRAAEAARKARTTQWIALGVIVVVVIALVWAFLPRTEEPVAGAPAVKQLQYDAPPAMTIDVNKQYFANVKMVKGGEFVIQLYPDKAPITVNNFVFLAREGYYDGTTFHRVLSDFMAQGGDPTGTGGGGPGYKFEDEPNDLSFDKAGILAMANSGPNTNGSQFFITYAPTPWLNGLHTIFGQVVEGMDVVMDLRLRDPQQNPDYVGDAIESITITEE